MSSKKIEQWEVERYWEIFTSLANGATHLDGSQAATVLKNSQLRDDQLERVWDLADVDNDGRLDFEEFCVAMRIVFDLVNGEYANVPATLPDWLVPESKAHLVQAQRALNTRETFARPVLDDEEDEALGLKDGFDWYMTPSQRTQYTNIYSSARDAHGYVSFPALSDLYASLADTLPDTDVRSAWNLVNPSADSVIGKDACLAYLHVLRARSDGYRMPRSVPASLRATFEKKDIDYDLNRAKAASSRWASNGTSSSHSAAGDAKAAFGDAYLSRLGGTTSSGPATKGTDFSNTPTTADWEEVRLKKQLRDLEDRIAKVENSASGRRAAGRRETSSVALVKRELEQLLDYKRGELRKVQDGEEGEGGKGTGGLKNVREDIDVVREQVDGLQAHLKSRETVLDGLRAQIREEKAR